MPSRLPDFCNDQVSHRNFGLLDFIFQWLLSRRGRHSSRMRTRKWPFIPLFVAAALGFGDIRAVAQNSSNSQPSTPAEGCKLEKYKGKVPLTQVENYFPGEEDLRGGMTCRFRIDPDLAVFIFHFAGQEDNTLGDLDVIESDTGDVVQTIERTIDPGDIYPGTALDRVLHAVDANFDGYRDLQILSSCGATGNCSYNFYLYDPKQEEFVHNDFLSDLGTPSFDMEKKQVNTNWNTSVADYQKETYQYEDGKYSLIHKEVSTSDREAYIFTVNIYELRDGEMQLVNSTTAPLP